MSLGCLPSEIEEGESDLEPSLGLYTFLYKPECFLPSPSHVSRSALASFRAHWQHQWLMTEKIIEPARRETEVERWLASPREAGGLKISRYRETRGIVQSSVCLFFTYLSLSFSFFYLPWAFFFLCGLQEKSLIHWAEHKVQPRPEGHGSILHLLGEIYFPSPYQTHQMSRRKGTGFGGKRHAWPLISQTYKRLFSRAWPITNPIMCTRSGPKYA